MIKLTYEDIKEKIIDSFIKNNRKQTDRIIYFDNSEKSYCWATDKRLIILIMKYNNISDIEYFKINKSKGLKIE